MMCYFLHRCIFLPSNGSFFVNYVITAAFIGTALELLRFSELFVYGVKLLLSRSQAEAAAVRKVTIAIIYTKQQGCIIFSDDSLGKFWIFF